MKHKPWSPKELGIIISHYRASKCWAKHAAKQLPDRTVSSIYGKAYKLRELGWL